MTAPNADITQVLSQIDGWPTGFAAAATVGPSGEVARRGDTHRVVRVASIAKLATALAVLLAVEERSVDLDGPLGPTGSTVRHLLCHASGLDFDSPRVIAGAGTRRIYSNSGYELLAAHVERRTGMAFAEYLREGVLQPLAMGSSTLDGSAAKDLNSNVEDLLGLAAEYRSPSLVDPSTGAEALRTQFPELAGVLPGWGRHDPCPWGLGPELRGQKSPHWTGSTASPTTFGHFGGSGSLLWVDPEASVTCIVLTDREFGPWAVPLWPPFCDAVRAAYA